jgi:tetratricopeptide (TPR) repeat protein
LSIDINHVEANLLLGKIYLNDGKYRDSSTYLWKVSSINPNHCEIQQYISVMKMKMKECLEKANQNVIKRKPDMGLLWTSKALSMYPCHPEALMLRSAINKTLGRFKESLEDLNNAYLNRNIDNNSAKVLEQISLTYNDLSLYLLKNKNLGEADKILDEALKFNNQDLNTHLNKGNCMMLKKDINKALEEFLFCLQLNPKCLQAKSQCALIYYKFAIMSFNNRDYQNTINNIERAMSYYQNSAEFYMLRARCYLKMSLLTKASNDINTAYLLNPNNKEINEFKKYFAELQ